MGVALIEFSRETARELLLAAQGLDSLPERPATKDDVLGAVRRMGVLQIDSISVVARSPYLVLWSRLGLYEPRWLDELLAEGALFEYWSHAACFIPIEDYGLYRGLMLGDRENPVAWMRAHPDAMEHVIAAGELMISRRENFHRVYDLRERVLERALPDWEDALAPTEQEVRRT